MAYDGDLAVHRAGVAVERRAHLQARARHIAPANRMLYHTDAAHGVVPLQVAEAATERRAADMPASAAAPAPAGAGG